MRTDIAQPIRLKDYLPPAWLVETVHLDVSLHPTETKVRAKIALKPNPKSAAAPLVLDGDGLSLTSLKLDGAPLPPSSFVASPNQLTIPQPPNGAFTLEIETLVDPSANTQLSGLYRSSGTYCTQCEAEGFRRITYFPDRPDVMAVYTTRIEADRQEAPVLLANGNLIDSGALDSGRHFAVWHDPHPKPSYLFALVGGDLACVEDTFRTMSGRDVTLRIYVEHGKQDRCAYAMDSLKRSMKWDEEAFGREYDLDIFMIVAVSDFNMGAMENKGLNVFNDKYVLASAETATDADFAHIEAVIAHEYFHNWTGNRITCRDWFQLCLKEGLTVYRDHEFSADQRSRAVKRIAEVRHLRSEQFPEDAGPLAHPVRPTKFREINNFYTATVYEKGSEVTRMIATILGRDGFKKGMDLYFERHDGEAATVEDFVKSFEDANGRDLTQFSLWYHQAGTPQITVSSTYDAGAKTLSLSLEQMVPATPGQTAKEPMHIPLKFALIGENGSEASPAAVSGGEVSGDVLHLTERSQTFVFTGIGARPVVSLNRSFSAPVTLHFAQSKEDLAHIARHDSDLFARWQAITDLALPNLMAAAKAAAAGKAIECDAGLSEALLAIAADDTLEAAFRAQALALPSESDIARELGSNNDPDAIYKGRQAILSAIATAGADTFRSLYDGLASGGSFTPDAASAGRRALRNAALGFLALSDKCPAGAAQAFATADNMTDLAQALTVLAHRFPEAPETHAALAAFESRFASNALVLDKWFAIQATIPGEGSLDRVMRLMQNPHFAASNPNRVRSLIGTFAFANATGFNRPDGKAYHFFAEEILAIDKRNPQLAARLLTALRSWRLLEPVRAEQAREALMTIERAAPQLSSDVADIVERILKG